MSWEKVLEFEAQVAKFFGSKWAVATDSCTHAVELCLRLKQIKELSVPKRTYLSIPFLAHKLNIPLTWRDENWEGYYFIGNTNIADAAVFWEKDGYIPDTFMCLSFQFQKHLSLGRGGMILTDDKEAYMALKKMSYDGRHPHAPWREQNIDSIGYHY
jgi:dTDP-4-amino-4,6-dideoxygalactose transaminase